VELVDDSRQDAGASECAGAGTISGAALSVDWRAMVPIVDDDSWSGPFAMDCYRGFLLRNERSGRSDGETIELPAALMVGGAGRPTGACAASAGGSPGVSV